MGSGHALEELRNAVAGSAYAARISVSGACDGDQVFAELVRSDLLVCPTTGQFAEGLAKTPVEATLTGMPSLISTVVPAGALLGDAVDDAAVWVNALDRLARDPARLTTMSRAAIEQRTAFFDRRLSLGARLFRAFSERHDRTPADSTLQEMSLSGQGIPILRKVEQ